MAKKPSVEYVHVSEEGNEGFCEVGVITYTTEEEFYEKLLLALKEHYDVEDVVINTDRQTMPTIYEPICSPTVTICGDEDESFEASIVLRRTWLY